MLSAPKSPAHRSVLIVKGPLRVPHTGEVARNVRALVRSGERRIVLDLARVAAIDAAGIGELVYAYGRLAAVDGALRIVGAGARVRLPLERVGLFHLLSKDGLPWGDP